jgi:hypothetical protein
MAARLSSVSCAKGSTIPAAVGFTTTFAKIARATGEEVAVSLGMYEPAVTVGASLG